MYTAHVYSMYIRTYVCMYTAHVYSMHIVCTQHMCTACTYICIYVQELVLYTHLVNREKLSLSAVKDVQKKQNFNFLTQKDMITVKYVCVN